MRRRRLRHHRAAPPILGPPKIGNLLSPSRLPPTWMARDPVIHLLQKRWMAGQRAKNKARRPRLPPSPTPPPKGGGGRLDPPRRRVAKNTTRAARKGFCF